MEGASGAVGVHLLAMGAWAVAILCDLIHPNVMVVAFIGLLVYAGARLRLWQITFLAIFPATVILDLPRRGRTRLGPLARDCDALHERPGVDRPLERYCSTAVPYALNCGETHPVSGMKGKRHGLIVAVRHGKRTVRSLWCVSRSPGGSCEFHAKRASRGGWRFT